MPFYCYCNSGLVFSDCCGPFHRREASAVTAETLMRSRYSAFCHDDAAYLTATWDARTCPPDLSFTDNRQRWQKLEIIGSVGGIDDLTGQVEFNAYFIEDASSWCLHEVSRFVKNQGHWLYLDGVTRVFPVTGNAAKTGQNAPCPCGSGKKFKRCCGERGNAGA